MHVLGGSFQVSMFSLPSREEKGAMKWQFICAQLYHSLSNPHQPLDHHLVLELMLIGILEAESQDLLLSMSKHCWYGVSLFLSLALMCALTACSKCGVALLDLWGTIGFLLPLKHWKMHLRTAELSVGIRNAQCLLTTLLVEVCSPQNAWWPVKWLVKAFSKHWEGEWIPFANESWVCHVFFLWKAECIPVPCCCLVFGVLGSCSVLRSLAAFVGRRFRQLMEIWHKQSVSQLQYQGIYVKLGFPVVVARSSGSAADQSCHLRHFIPLDVSFLFCSYLTARRGLYGALCLYSIWLYKSLGLLTYLSY